MSTRVTTSTEVEIFGSIYPVRGDSDADALHSLARTVDERMREVSEHIATSDPAKVAVLTALNLADELARLKSELEGERTEVRDRIAGLSEKLQQALKSP